MPRLSNSLLRRARALDPLLPLLLRACRDLDSAKNELRWLHLHVLGVDAYPGPVGLAKENLAYNIRQGLLPKRAKDQISFVQGDVFSPDVGTWATENWDILVSNPPYISPNGFNKTITHSVRNYEPKSALVPSSTSNGNRSDVAVGDHFYPQLLKIASRVRAKVLLMEVADMPQAYRVAAVVLEHQKWDRCEIWRDWPAQGSTLAAKSAYMQGREIIVRGEGYGRAVFAWSDNRP
ncbi:MAG: hypothetical protein Q9163_002584 [Psora crenata]